MNTQTIILEKYNSAFINALDQQLAVYTTIGGKNESPMWFQFVEHKYEESKLFFRSSQVSYMFFHIELSKGDNEYYFEYKIAYDHFRTLKYSHIKESWPSVYYEVRKNEKPVNPVVLELIEDFKEIREEQPTEQETDYQTQAIEFLKQTGTTFTATFKRNDYYFPGDNQTRDIYSIVLKNKTHRYRFNFGQSINDSNYGNTPPTAYDVLACLTKYDVGSFADFCNEFGYDTDSRSAYKTYKAVLKEWKNIELLFTSEQIELLQEIN